MFYRAAMSMAKGGEAARRAEIWLWEKRKKSAPGATKKEELTKRKRGSGAGARG
jgi:hypothetical protein